MANLPSGTDIPLRPVRPTGIDPRAREVDFTPLDRGNQAIASGIVTVGAGMRDLADDSIKREEFDAQKRFLDFKLKSEMELEDLKRVMPVGGNGFTQAWQERFGDLASQFVGEKDANVPKHMRDRMGYLIKQHEVSLDERAQRYELGERDRYHVDSLETQLGAARDAVGANPNRRDEMANDGRALIEKALIPPADKYRLAKKYEKELDKTQATARLLAIQNADDREAFRKGLRLDQEDIVGADASAALTSGVAKGKAAGWAATDPTWAKLSPYQKAAAMALLEADNADPDAARNALGAMINRAAKGGEDLGAHVSQKIYQPTIEPAQQARLGKILSSPAFADLTGWAERRAKGQEVDPVQGATHFLASEKTMLGLEAQDPQKYRSWRKWTGFDGQQYKDVITRDNSHAFLAPDGKREEGIVAPGEEDGPRKPYAALSLMERREIWKNAETEWKKKISETDQLIKHMGDRAAHGDLPPDAELKAIGARVSGLGDDVLSAKWESMVATAAIQNRMMDAPPAAGAAYATQMRNQIAAAQDGRYSEEQAKILDRLDKTNETVRKHVNEDPMGWANRRQLEVPTGDYVQPGATDELGKPLEQATRRIQLKPINLDPRNKQLDMQLRERFEAARDVGRYYNQPPQVFTKAERDALKDFVGRGGAPLLDVLSAVVRNGGDDAMGAIREISKDAPEAYMIGKLINEGGDPYLIETAAKEMQKRATEKEKYINKVDKKLSEPDVSALMPALQMTPGLVDPVKHMTDTLYNFEHRRQGKDTFDATLYKDLMGKVLGERVAQDGTKYGGVGDHGGIGGAWNYFGFGSGQRVLVPPQVRQDSFNAMVGAIRMEDFGTNPPVDKNMKPLTLREIQTAQWRSLGNGRYGLMMERNENTGEEKFAFGPNGRPYVLDVKPMLPAIKLRKPEIF